MKTVDRSGPPAPHASRAMILAAFAAIYLIWGSTYLAIKVAIETVPPFLMTGVRFLIAGGALYAWSVFRPSRRLQGTEHVQPSSLAAWRAFVGRDPSSCRAVPRLYRDVKSHPYTVVGSFRGTRKTSRPTIEAELPSAVE